MKHFLVNEIFRRKAIAMRHEWKLPFYRGIYQILWTLNYYYELIFYFFRFLVRRIWVKNRFFPKMHILLFDWYIARHVSINILTNTIISKTKQKQNIWKKYHQTHVINIPTKKTNSYRSSFFYCLLNSNQKLIFLLLDRKTKIQWFFYENSIT